MGTIELKEYSHHQSKARARPLALVRAQRRRQHRLNSLNLHNVRLPRWRRLPLRNARQLGGELTLAFLRLRQLSPELLDFRQKSSVDRRGCLRALRLWLLSEGLKTCVFLLKLRNTARMVCQYY